MSNNWIYKTQQEQKTEGLIALKKAKELETLNKKQNGQIKDIKKVR